MIVKILILRELSNVCNERPFGVSDSGSSLYSFPPTFCLLAAKPQVFLPHANTKAKDCAQSTRGVYSIQH